MARPPAKFLRRVEVWTTPEQFEAIGRLHGVGTLSRAGHLRRAVEMYLEFIARNTPAPRPITTANGVQHQVGVEHGNV